MLLEMIDIIFFVKFINIVIIRRVMMVISWNFLSIRDKYLVIIEVSGWFFLVFVFFVY